MKYMGAEKGRLQRNLPTLGRGRLLRARTTLADIHRSDRVLGGRFRGGVSIYVLDGFRLVLNSNRTDSNRILE